MRDESMAAFARMTCALLGQLRADGAHEIGDRIEADMAEAVGVILRAASPKLHASILRYVSPELPASTAGRTARWVAPCR